MGVTRAAAVKQRDNDGHIQLAPRSSVAARAVVTRGLAPEAIEARKRLLRCDTASHGALRASTVLEPRGAARQRLGLQELGVVVMAGFLFPDIAAGLSHPTKREDNAPLDDLAQGLAHTRVVAQLWRLLPPAQERYAAHRRTVGLRPGPAGGIGGAGGIDTSVRPRGLPRK